MLALGSEQSLVAVAVEFEGLLTVIYTLWVVVGGKKGVSLSVGNWLDLLEQKMVEVFLAGLCCVEYLVAVFLGYCVGIHLVSLACLGLVVGGMDH